MGDYLHPTSALTAGNYIWYKDMCIKAAVLSGEVRAASKIITSLSFFGLHIMPKAFQQSSAVAERLQGTWHSAFGQHLRVIIFIRLLSSNKIVEMKPTTSCGGVYGVVL